MRMVLEPAEDVVSVPTLPRVTVGGVTLDPKALPPGLEHRADLGILLAEGLAAQHVHGRLASGSYTGAPRAVETAGGEILLMFAAGSEHFFSLDLGGPRGKVNEMVAYRSSDGGQTWRGPTVAWDVPYPQVAAVLLRLRDSNTLYAFGMEPRSDVSEGENAGIGFRRSDDDGHSWSDVTIIRPENDPGFLGMSCMSACETEAGTWLIGSHTGSRYFRDEDGKRRVRTRHYLLRSPDQGRTWTIHPGPRPHGWYWEPAERMDEGWVLHLGDSRALMVIRTEEGHLWEVRSDDDGKTWSEPAPTTLVHPDAPPAFTHLPDGKTLLAIYHNRHTGGMSNGPDRSELWAATSSDDGRTWSEPRFVLANTSAPSDYNQGELTHRGTSVSYVHPLVSNGTLHLFFPHQFHRMLHVSLPLATLDTLPTRTDLLHMAAQSGG